MRSKAVLGFSTATLAFLAVGTPLCRAQYPDDVHPIILDAGAGKTSVQGADKRNFGSFVIYQAGAGILFKSRPDISNGDSQAPTRHWNAFFKGNFMYGQADLKPTAVQPIISANPQNPSLLAATAGSGKFYCATLGPGAQYSRGRVSLFGQAGFGWLRRSIDLTGATTEGTVLQPNNPSVFVQSGNSGAFRGSIGVAAGTKGVRAFVEAGLVQGFAINHGTMLAPMLSGGVRW